MQREAEIIELHASGMTAARIAKALGMASSSVRTKISRLKAQGRMSAAPSSLSEDEIGASKVAAIVEGIEAEAARKSRIARMTFCDATAALKAEHRSRQEAIAAQEREDLKAIERWRVKMIADAEGGPVPLGDLRSVKREDVVSDARGVSLPKLRCLA